MLYNLTDSADAAIDVKEVSNPAVKKTGGDNLSEMGVANHKPLASKDDEMGTDNGAASSESQKVPILVAVMLIVPIVCVLIILLGFKIYNTSEYLPNYLITCSMCFVPPELQYSFSFHQPLQSKKSHPECFHHSLAD